MINLETGSRDGNSPDGPSLKNLENRSKICQNLKILNVGGISVNCAISVILRILDLDFGIYIIGVFLSKMFEKLMLQSRDAHMRQGHVT